METSVLSAVIFILAAAVGASLLVDRSSELQREHPPIQAGVLIPAVCVVNCETDQLTHPTRRCSGQRTGRTWLGAPQARDSSGQISPTG